MGWGTWEELRFPDHDLATQPELCGQNAVRETEVGEGRAEVKQGSMPPHPAASRMGGVCTVKGRGGGRAGKERTPWCCLPIRPREKLGSQPNLSPKWLELTDAGRSPGSQMPLMWPSPSLPVY